MFAGEARELRVFGPDLEFGQDEPVFVDGEQIGALIAVRAGEGRVAVPGLARGEHFLQVGSPATDERPGARLFAVERTHYDDATILIPGRAESLVHDLERNAFFGVFSDRYGERAKLARIQYREGTWSVDPIDVASPHAVTITADGRELLVTNTGCIPVHVNADTLALGEIVELPTPCGYDYGMIHAFADGQVLYGRTVQWTSIWEYPSFEEVQSPLFDSATHVMSLDQTRMIWASAPTISGGHSIFSYDVGLGMFDDFTTLGGDYYLNNLVISADGHRFMHDGDVYDQDFGFLGSLSTGGQKPWSVGLSGDGAVAVAFDLNAETLRAYDVRAQAGPCPALGAVVPFAAQELGFADHLLMDDRGETAFAFAIRSIGNDTNEYRLAVRNVVAASALTTR